MRTPKCHRRISRWYTAAKIKMADMEKYGVCLLLFGQTGCCGSANYQMGPFPPACCQQDGDVSKSPFLPIGSQDAHRKACYHVSNSANTDLKFLSRVPSAPEVCVSARQQPERHGRRTHQPLDRKKRSRERAPLLILGTSLFPVDVAAGGSRRATLPMFRP